MEHSPYNSMVGVSFHFTNGHPCLKKFGCSLCWATPMEQGHYRTKDHQVSRGKKLNAHLPTRNPAR